MRWISFRKFHEPRAAGESSLWMTRSALRTALRFSHVRIWVLARVPLHPGPVSSLPLLIRFLTFDRLNLGSRRSARRGWSFRCFVETLDSELRTRSVSHSIFRSDRAQVRVGGVPADGKRYKE
jgi:hypothetical protein